jgi:hypothetical protein
MEFPSRKIHPEGIERPISKPEALAPFGGCRGLSRVSGRNRLPAVRSGFSTPERASFRVLVIPSPVRKLPFG